MLKKSLYRQTLVTSFLLLLSACDVAQNAQRDFNRVMHASLTTPSSPTPTYSQARATPRPAATPAAKPDAAKPTEEAARSEPAPAATPSPPSQDVNLMGKNEGQVRTLLGAPTSVEERAPGKTWHYQDGQCSVDVQLYPDVQTRQYGTLAYKVNSNDNSDEGRRECLARLRSRAQP